MIHFCQTATTKKERDTFHLYRFFLIVGAITFFTISSVSSDFILSTQEKRWLAEHNTSLRIGITTIPNQVIKTKKGHYEGFAIDFYKLLEQRLGIIFDYLYFDTWEDLIKAVQQRKIDILFLAQKNPERLRYLHFSDSILHIHNKLIVAANNPSAPTVKTLFSAHVAVTEGSALADYLQKRFAGIHIIQTPNACTALRMVSEGKADATVLGRVRAGQCMRQEHLLNLQVIDDIGYDYHLRTANRNDMPMLSHLLDKVTASLSKKQLEALYLKWGYLKNEPLIDKQTLLILAAGGIIIMLLSVYLYMVNNRLKHQIKERKKGMEHLHRVLEKQKRIEHTLEERVTKEVEKNKIQQLQLMQQNRLAVMGELLSMIAHQWRQPLNTLSILIHILIKSYKKGKLDDAILHRFESDAFKQIQLMSNTINDFRDFFSPDMHHEPFDVLTSVKETVSIIQPALDKYGIEINVNALSTPVVDNYPQALAQALLNILNNAKDALVDRNIRQRNIVISIDTHSNNDIVITIDDTAGGIDEKILPKIFDPYFSTKTKKEGTGLGLYMAKKVIEEQIKGTISVQNTDEGAKFTIRFGNLHSDSEI
jgi:signal transduction histidine kinase/ABC-type amino acid transport substrate-binding protein